MLTRQYIQGMNEDNLRKQVLIPLLTAMRYEDVFEYHGGAGELGKDIVCWKSDVLGCRRNLAIVAKAVLLSGKAVVGKGTAGEVQTQIQQCFGKPYLDTVKGDEQFVDECWVISNKKISKEFEDAIIAAMLPRRNVSFVGIDKLWSLVQEYMPAKAAISKLVEASRVFDEMDTHYRLRAHTSGKGIVFDVEEKFPGASDEKPFEINATFNFPDTEEGKEAREAFAQHLATGTPVEIPGAFAQIKLPDSFQTIFDTSLPIRNLRLESANMDVHRLMRIELRCNDGDSFDIEYVDLKPKQSGLKQVLFTNDEQPIPIQVSLALDFEAHQFHIQFSAPLRGQNVMQLLNALKIERCLCKGCLVTLLSIETGLVVAQGWLKPNGETFESAYAETIADLVVVQKKIGRPITLPNRELTEQECNTLDKLRFINQFGVLTAKWQGVSLEVLLKDLTTSLNADQTLSVSFQEVENEEVFGIQLPLGRVMTTIERARIVNIDEVQEQIAKVTDPMAPVAIHLRPSVSDLAVREYLDWLPEQDQDAGLKNEKGDM